MKLKLCPKLVLFINYSQWQKKAKVQEFENNKARIVILLMIILVVVMIVVVILYAKNIRKRKADKKRATIVC